jgi:hypothetical protein
MMSNLFTYYCGSLTDFLKDVEGNQENRLVKINLTPVSVETTDSSFSHVLDNFAVKHILKKHANAKEVLRGQILVETKDLLLIPDILANFDTREIQTQSTGRTTVCYSKLYPDCIRFYVEEVREGRHELAGVTFYKRKKETHRR